MASAAWCLVRQLVSAIAALHEEAADVAHGAIAAERIIVTPDARLMVVEHALASALKHVRLSHEQFWKELRVACPRAASAAPFDHRSDIMQIGVVALSLLLGRALQRRRVPVADCRGSSSPPRADASGKPMPEPLRSWLSRALQLKGRESFASAIEASALLDEALEKSHCALQSVTTSTLPRPLPEAGRQRRGRQTLSSVRGGARAGSVGNRQIGGARRRTGTDRPDGESGDHTCGRDARRRRSDAGQSWPATRSQGNRRLR